MAVQAVVFPGQGAQQPHMASDFVREFDICRTLFKSASEIVGFDVEQYCASAQSLKRTDIAQPCLLTVEYAMYSALRDRFDFQPRWFAGHSLGEFTALVAAGAIPFETALEVVSLRGQLMHEIATSASDDMMALTMESLPLEEVKGLATECGVELANLNSARQVVICGPSTALDLWRAKMRPFCERGARIVPLELGVAFHSSRMTPVVEELRRALERCAAQIDPSSARRVVSNYTGDWHKGTTKSIIDALAKQAANPVLWTSNMNCLRQLGVENIAEVGPKSVLKSFFATQGTTIEPITSVEDAQRKLLQKNSSTIPHDSQGPFRLYSLASSVLETSAKAAEQYFAHQKNILSVCEGISEPERSTLLSQMIEAGSRVTSELITTQREVAKRIGGASSGLERDELSPQASNSTPSRAAEHESPVLHWLKKDISRITGFEVESLDLSMEFERDLGLDSMSMLEIFATMCKRFPEIEKHAIKLRGVKSIGDIAQLIDRLPGDNRISENLQPCPGPKNQLLSLQTEEASGSPRDEQSRSMAPEHVTQTVIEKLKCDMIKFTADHLGVDYDSIKTNAELEIALGVSAFDMEAILTKACVEWPALKVAGQELYRACTLDDLVTIVSPFLHEENRALRESVAPLDARYALKDSSPSAHDGADKAISRYTLSWREVSMADGPTPDRILLVSPDDTLHTELVQTLVADGCDVRRVILSHKGFSAQVGRDDALIRVHPGDLDKCLRQLIEEEYRAILISACGQTNALREADGVLWQDHLERMGGALLQFVQALKHSMSLANKTLRIGLVGLEGQCPALSAAKGFFTALSREWFEIPIRTVWLSGALTSYRGPQLLRALFCGDTENHLNLGADGRLLRATATREKLARPWSQNISLERGSHVLFVGGGGIAEELAVHLAKKAGCRIGFVTRTALPESEVVYPVFDEQTPAKYLSTARCREEQPSISDANERLDKQRRLWKTKQRIERAGGRFSHVAADATSEGQLVQAISTLERQNGPVRGLILTACMTADAKVERKSAETFRRIVNTKALPAFWLHRHFAERDLAIALLFSSQSTYVGVPGQTDYAAANEVLNDIAAQWNQEASYPVRALLWSLWTETGFVSRSAVGSSFVKSLELKGVENDAGACWFETELTSKSKVDAWAMLSSPAMLRQTLAGQLW